MIVYEADIRRAYSNAWNRLSTAANMGKATPPSLVLSRSEGEGLVVSKLKELSRRYPITLNQNTEGRELALGYEESGITYCQVFTPAEGQKFPVQIVLGPVFLGNFKNARSIKPYVYHELSHIVRYMTQPEIAVYSDAFSERTRGNLVTLRDVFDFCVEESVAWSASFLETRNIKFIVRHLQRLKKQGNMTVEDVAVIVEQIDAYVPTVSELLTSNGFMERIGHAMKSHRNPKVQDMGDVYLGYSQDLKNTRARMDNAGMELYVL
ncbi:MAG: hypothetical protein HYT71_02690 [Candidatus Aenigmarchaeota archaeon]|nr:hypothetical protein [Candidatus Aenigmarchaeota archaeon]